MAWLRRGGSYDWSTGLGNQLKKVNIFGDDWLEEYEELQTNPKAHSIDSGLPTINRICHDQGMRRGFGPWLICCAGNPGIGKTTVALSMCAAALKQGHSVGMINLEQTNIQLSTRLYSIYTGQKLRDLEPGGFNKFAWTVTKQAFEDAPALYVPEGILMSWEEILSYARSCAEEGCKFFCLDYLQLATTGSEEAIYSATQSVVTELRRFCLETESTVLMLSQWNRSGSTSEKPPTAQHLHGGMIVEASCDMVLGLDHTTVIRKGSKGYFKLLILKNRHGELIQGGIPLEIDFANLRVSEVSPDVDPWR